jgi:hypothetical protein
MDVADKVLTVILAGAAGVLAWFAANWVGKPIADARDKCLKALKVAEQNAHVGYLASAERIVEARAALNDAVSDLRSISRGQSWPVRLYCWFVGYDLETAARALIGLHRMIGHYDDEGRQFFDDAVHVFLRAHPHLKRERVDEIKRQAEQW